MNFSPIFYRSFISAALMSSVALVAAQDRIAPDSAPASKAQSAPVFTSAETPQSITVGGFLLVQKESAGRDQQGRMRIKLVDGGIKLPSKP
jgi:hypothetical protein